MKHRRSYFDADDADAAAEFLRGFGYRAVVITTTVDDGCHEWMVEAGEEPESPHVRAGHYIEDERAIEEADVDSHWDREREDREMRLERGARRDDY